MVEYDGKLFIIDQHAAHEKVLYEKLMKAFSQKALQKQMLSPPVILTLSMQEENIYKQYADYFAELGFEIELFGGREYAVRGVPLQLFGMNARDIFIEVLDSVTEESRRWMEVLLRIILQRWPARRRLKVIISCLSKRRIP